GNASGHVGGATNTKSHLNNAFKAPQSMEFEQRDVCSRCGVFDHWAHICRAREEILTTYKAYCEAREAHYVEQEDQDDDLE
ncbi:hypothetical protein PSY47_23345, partial [Shigella flexneri]|nr:hypothetical protein [Shigella flexneri]